MKEKSPLVNEKIRAPKLQLITSTGENVGVVSRGEALRSAEEANLDLVMIADSGAEGVPVVKVMDLGKSLYEKKKKQAEAKKHQKVIQIKEIKIRPKISVHDYQTKMKQGIKFLEAGKRLKVSLFFRGRENINKDARAAELFDRINKTFDEHGLLQNLIQEPNTRGRQLISRVYYLKSAK